MGKAKEALLLWPIALSPTTATANQRASWVTNEHPGRGQQLHGAEDGHDPAPGAQIADHVAAPPMKKDD